jgi:hypothetical protein
VLDLAVDKAGDWSGRENSLLQGEKKWGRACFIAMFSDITN